MTARDTIHLQSVLALKGAHRVFRIGAKLAVHLVGVEPQPAQRLLHMRHIFSHVAVAQGCEAIRARAGDTNDGD